MRFAAHGLYTCVYPMVITVMVVIVTRYLNPVEEAISSNQLRQLRDTSTHSTHNSQWPRLDRRLREREGE